MKLYSCNYCSYKSDRMYNLKVHQRNKHEMREDEVEKYPLPLRSEEQPSDGELMVDSIVVFKIYKLLQRMKNS